MLHIDVTDTVEEICKDCLDILCKYLPNFLMDGERIKNKEIEIEMKKTYIVVMFPKHTGCFSYYKILENKEINTEQSYQDY